MLPKSKTTKTMGIGKYGKIVIYIIISLFSLLACNSQKDGKIVRSEVDVLLISKFDSIFTYPEKMKTCFREVQKKTSDSADYYKLELFTGYCLYLQGYPDSALHINQKVLTFCKQHPETSALEGMCWNHRSSLLQGMNQRDSSIACLHHAYNATYRSHDRLELENICINLADAYRQKGELVQASKYYRKALWVVDSLKSEYVKFSIYMGLAQTYADLHNFTLAHRYFDLAEQVPEQRLEYENYHFLNSKGNCLYYEEKYAEALPYFQQAYQVVKPFNQPSFNALVEANLGEIYMLLGKYDSAHYYLDKSCSVFMNDSTANEEVLFYLNSLQGALALRENKLEAANRYLSKPYNPQRIGPSYIYLHNKRLMEYYAQKKDFEKAYSYKNIVEQYDDSMRNVRNINNINEIDYRYSQDTTLLKKDILISNDKIRLSRQQNAIMFFIGLLVISILLAILIFIYIRRKNEQRYNRQMALATQLRMENIRNRISPHYVFNVLNAVMPTFKQYSELAQPLQLLIRVLRGNLLASEKIAVELQEEIELVKNYIALRKEINPDNINIKWEIDEQAPIQTLIPSMCIQIPVENALKYAFGEECEQENVLSIQISNEIRGLSIHIRDNGSGYDPGKHTDSKRGTGNGLKVLFRTIELLNNKNSEKIIFDIQNLATSSTYQHGTLVTIVVPFNYQFNI